MLYSKEKINSILNLTTEQNTELSNNLGIISNEAELRAYGNTIINDRPYLFNEWAKTLLNTFVYTAQSKGKFFTSIFDYFREKRDNIPFGTYEVDVAPIMPVEYDMKAFDRDLTFWETAVRPQYFSITRRDVFPQTLNNETIAHIFDSYEDMDDFLYSVLIAPRKGNTIIENNAVKEIINKNFESGAIVYKEIDPITKLNAEEICASIQENVLNMTSEPTADYNKYQELSNSPTPVYAQSARDDLVFMGTSSSIATLKTYVLAFAFHKEEADFNFHFVPVGKSFGYDIYNSEVRDFIGRQESPIQFIICDGGFIKLEDKLDIEVEGTKSVMTLNIQHATHVWQSINLRMFRNAIAYVVKSEESGGYYSDLTFSPNTFILTEPEEMIEFDVLSGDASTIFETIHVKMTYGANGYGHEIPPKYYNAEAGNDTLFKYMFALEFEDETYKKGYIGRTVYDVSAQGFVDDMNPDDFIIVKGYDENNKLVLSIVTKASVTPSV